jgi:hypothetical protein
MMLIQLRSEHSPLIHPSTPHSLIRAIILAFTRFSRQLQTLRLAGPGLRVSPALLSDARHTLPALQRLEVSEPSDIVGDVSVAFRRYSFMGF